jgi:hypothetical protein
MGEAGDAAGAAEALRELLADRQRVLGPDHPDTLVTRHNLARWMGEAGDAAGAAEALRELLADRQRVLGPDHPDTLTSPRYGPEAAAALVADHPRAGEATSRYRWAARTGGRQAFQRATEVIPPESPPVPPAED